VQNPVYVYASRAQQPERERERLLAVEYEIINGGACIIKMLANTSCARLARPLFKSMQSGDYFHAHKHTL